MIDDQTLLEFVRDALSPEESRAIEAALRNQPDLRNRLARLIESFGLDEIAPGTVWKNFQLSCPSRENWGSFLLGVLDPQTADYCRFHLDVVECDFCRANVEDLKERTLTASSQLQQRHRRIFHSSVGKNLTSLPFDRSASD